ASRAAVCIDCDAVTGAENAATGQGRPRRAVPAIGRLAIGLEYQVEITGVRCALERVVRYPRVSSSVERDVPGAANQKIRLVATRIVDLDRPRPGIGSSNERRRIQVAQQRQRENCIHVLPRVASEVRQRLGGIVWRETAWRRGQIE